MTEWQGTPKESDEMRPKWFPLSAIPYPQMWPTDVAWLPFVLDDKQIQIVVHRRPAGQRVCEFLEATSC